MKRDRKKVWFSVIAVLLVLIIGAGVYAYYLFVWLGKHEPETMTDKTNTDAVYTEQELQEALSKYPELENLGFDGDYEKNSYVIPGLKSTRTFKSNKAKEISVCTSMTPQGVCVVEDYLLISAYCHTKEHNSVIYVIDKESHEFVKEIVLNGKPHVGGLAYDTEHKNIWVACYKKGTAYVNSFKLDALKQYSLDENMKPLDFEQEYPIYSILRASFLYYEEGGLYVGYFSTAKKNEIRSIQKFLIEEDGTLQLLENPAFGTDDKSGKDEMAVMPADIATIDADCQGMAFSDELILISQSRGVLKSKLQMFVNQVGADESVMKLENDRSLLTCTLPPQLEQLYVNDGELYLLFESGAYAYRSWPTTSVDRVLKMDITTPLEE